MEPTVRKLNIRPRGPTSSAEQNQWHQDVFYDLSRLYELLNETNIDTKRIVNLLLMEIIFLQKRIEELNNELQSLCSVVSNENEKEMILLPSVMQTELEGFEPDLNPCNIDREYCTVTLPMSSDSISKTHLVSSTTGEVLIPSELNVEIYPVSGDININISDEYVKDAFDGTSHRYWQRKVAYSSTSNVTHEECLMVIDLPTNIVNNLNANSFVIKPFPEHSIDIMAIYYNKYPEVENITFTQSDKDTHEEIIDKGWDLLPGFPTKTVDGAVIPDEILASRRMRFFFPSTPMTKVAIRLRQRNWIEEGGQKTFIIGAQEIDVQLSSYNSEGGYILTPFRPVIPEEASTFNILRVKHNFTNNNALSVSGRYDEENDTSSCLRYKIYKKEGDTLTLLEDYNSILAEECWIVTTLYPDPSNRCTPSLGDIRIRYSFNFPT